MNRKGFTLIELLATLVILGIVVGLAVYSIGNIFSNAKKKTEDVFVETIKDAMDMYLSSNDAKKLDYNELCNNLLNKSYGNKRVYREVITFSDVINSQYKPLATSDLVNPADEELECASPDEINISIYRDEDYVYYYSVSKSEFACLKETSDITNLPEGFVCE